jgi:hypothetical protein
LASESLGQRRARAILGGLLRRADVVAVCAGPSFLDARRCKAASARRGLLII